MPHAVTGKLLTAALTFAAVLLFAPATAQRFDPGTPREIAPGVLLYHLTAGALPDPDLPVSVWLLRLVPSKVRLELALAADRIVGTETVDGIAERHGAIAAINAGFFLPNGEPAGVMTIDGQLVSDTERPRGALGIVRSAAGPELLYGRLQAGMSLHVRGTDIPISGVNTTRERGKLMLFTPAYDTNTGTASGGLEWTVVGSPSRILAAATSEGTAAIPSDGFVLSYGGASVPTRLRHLRKGSQVSFATTYRPLDGRALDWARADDVVGGAGLLRIEGRPIDDWSVERLNPGFVENRHPRTMIGTGADGHIWLVAVDGRQPELSVGMTLVELRDFAERMNLVAALNLDGGGSTTMWMNGAIVNSPSDAAGPRKVGDALLVFVQ